VGKAKAREKVIGSVRLPGGKIVQRGEASDHGELQGSESRKLVVRMTDERLKEVATMVTDAAVAVHRLREEKRETGKEFKELIDGKEETLFQFAKIYADGGEQVDVACEVYADIQQNTKTVIRTDTGEVIEKAALTAKELEALAQGNLFTGAKGSDEEEGDGTGDGEIEEDEEDEEEEGEEE